MTKPPRHTAVTAVPLVLALLGFTLNPAIGQQIPPAIGYSVSLDDNALYQIDLRTGEARQRGNVQRNGIPFLGVIEMAFAPNGMLYGVDRDRDSLIQINPANGRVIREANIHGAIDHIPQHVGLTWYDDVDGTFPGVNNLVMIVAGIEGETDRLYRLLNEETSFPPFGTFQFGHASPLTDLEVLSGGVSMSMRQRNPLQPMASGGFEQVISSDGTVSPASDIIIDVPGEVLEVGTANLPGIAPSLSTNFAYIYVPDPAATSSMINTGVLLNDNHFRASTVTTSGVGNFQSLAMHADPFAIIPGDATLDGLVDVSDLAILAKGFGQPSGAQFVDGDFNDDGAIDVGDLAILANRWSGSNSLSFADALISSGLSIPEPCIASLLTLGLATGLGRRRRL